MRYLLVFLLLLVFFPAPARNPAVQVKVHGIAAAYAGDTLRFYIYDDMLSRKQIRLARLTVNQQGSFSGSLPLEETHQVFVDLGKIRGYFFAEPGHTYNLVLPPRQVKEVRDLLNPYFRQDNIHLGVANADSTELNNLIYRFDHEYDPFFYRHAQSVYSEMRTENLERFIDSLSGNFAWVNNRFFRDYVAFRFMALRVMTFADRNRVFPLYTPKAEKLLYTNPAYMNLFARVFQNYLGFLHRGPMKEQLDQAVMGSGGKTLLFKVMAQSCGTTSQPFLELAAAKSLYDGVYSNVYPREKLLSLLEQIRQESEYPRNVRIINNLLEKIHKLEPGSEAPDFRLTDVHGIPRNLSDFRGKYVYLNFSSRISYSSLRQFPLLKKLAESYGDSLNIITVAAEDNPVELKKLVEGRNYPWVFLVCPPSCNVVEQFGVRTFPTYYLLDPGGKFLLSPAPPPTENFKSIFQKILERSERQ